MTLQPGDIPIDADQERQLRELARRKGRPESEIVRAALEAYLAKQRSVKKRGDGKTLYDAMREAGAIGMIKDGPADLASNKAHLEGFGRDS